MSRPVLIQFGGNPDCKKKITFNFTFLVLLSLTVPILTVTPRKFHLVAFPQLLIATPIELAISK